MHFQIKYVIRLLHQELGLSEFFRQAEKVNYWCLPQLIRQISMLHFPLETRPLAGFIRPPARTQKWFCSALPARFRVTLICFSLSCGSTNWLIHSLSGRSGCRLLCEISCRFWCPEGLCTGTGVREEDYRFSVSVGVIAWKWSECWRLLPLLCLWTRVHMVAYTDSRYNCKIQLRCDPSPSQVLTSIFFNLCFIVFLLSFCRSTFFCFSFFVICS